ncbi:MAG TPA: M3 family metallopeptidase, partial [Chitinophagaceae bacterium]|nr:M3 family metallopeptidase [Chitinophagaceae bacterium]
MHILLEKFKTPYEAIPFDKIKEEDYKPAFEKAMEIAKNRVKSMIDSEEKPSFENFILPLEKATWELDQVSSIFFNLCSAETNDFLENLQAEIAPVLSNFTNDLFLNPDLFKKVKEVYDKEWEQLKDAEDKKLLEENYLFFVRNGALLDKEDQEQLKQIDEKLSLLAVQFSQNVLKETNAYYLHINKEEDLAGLTEDYKKQAAKEAKDRGKEGWIVTLDYPSYMPFMTYAENRALRKELSLAMGQRAYKNNEQNNEEIIKKIVQLRKERAKLLSYDNFAAYVLEKRMANSPDEVMQFLLTLKNKAAKAAKRDYNALKEIAEVEELKAYDHAFYAEKLRIKNYNISDEILKPYFSLENVKNAAFDLAYKLFDFKFQPLKDIPVYHKDVEVYEVLESGVHKGLLYMDWHPRKGKRAGAWMTSFKGQFKDEEGKNHRPHVAIVCNFSKPTENKPSLLTFNEVTTLFH